MTTGLRMFLMAAQEMNFSRAAQKAFVTPQCLSDHIKRLEEQYHVTLFRRRPRLQLTMEGEAMLRYLLRIQALEDNMENELADISGGGRGTIRFGVPATRGTILTSQIVPRFQAEFPNVEVQIYLNDTRTLEKLLLNGELDLFLGVDTNQHPLFQRQQVGRELLYLVVSRQLMRARYLERWEEMIRRFLEQGADLELLQNASMVQGHSNSTTTDVVQKFLLQHNISAQTLIKVSDFDVLVELCRTGRYMTVCARAHLYRLFYPRCGEEGAEKVYAFRIAGWDKYMEIELITHRDSRPLRYLEKFKEMMRQSVQREDETIIKWLSAGQI